jgi:hypothetical protein
MHVQLAVHCMGPENASQPGLISVLFGNSKQSRQPSSSLRGSAVLRQLRVPCTAKEHSDSAAQQPAQKRCTPFHAACVLLCAWCL